MIYNRGTYTFVSANIIDSQLTVVYDLLKKHRYDIASAVLNDIITSISNARIVHCEISVLSKIIDESYLTLVDIAMKRFNGAHDKVRNMHFMLINA